MAESTPDAGRRNERARLAILDASLALVGELGYDNVSIEAIARRAGVGKQTIYRWWPSKGAVVLEAATHSLDPVVKFPDTGDVVADLRRAEGVVAVDPPRLSYRRAGRLPDLLGDALAARQARRLVLCHVPDKVRHHFLDLDAESQPLVVPSLLDAEGFEG